ncbi:MAG: hypothetical protein AAGF90_13985, partial [Pseudomonadota bacterium]
IEQSLPDEVTFTLGPSGDGAFSISIASDDDRLDTGGAFFDDAFCVDVALNFIFDEPLVADVYLATDTEADGTPDQVEGLPDGIVPDEQNLDLVNWILNQDFRSVDNGDGTGTNYTGNEIQRAIWTLTNESDGYNNRSANAQEIVDLARAEGEGFIAGEGDKVAVILNPVFADDLPAADQPYQPFVVAYDYDTLKEDCIC